MQPPPAVADVERWLERLYIADPAATLRREERKKAVEVAAMLDEIRRAAARLSRSRPLVLVDAAAGKSYVGLLAAKLVLEPAGRPARVVTIERDPERAALAAALVPALETTVPVECQTGDVADPGVWPAGPGIVTALHACGPASDAIIDAAVAVEARFLLLVPCCTGAAVHAAGLAARAADSCAIPRHAPVRRRFIEVMVDSERTWRLEAAGYETEVVALCPPTVTPHNLLWRARRVNEPRRREAAAAALARLRAL